MPSAGVEAHPQQNGTKCDDTISWDLLFRYREQNRRRRDSQTVVKFERTRSKSAMMGNKARFIRYMYYLWHGRASHTNLSILAHYATESHVKFSFDLGRRFNIVTQLNPIFTGVSIFSDLSNVASFVFLCVGSGLRSDVANAVDIPLPLALPIGTGLVVSDEEFYSDSPGNVYLHVYLTMSNRSWILRF